MPEVATNLTFRVARTGPDQIQLGIFDQGIRNILGPNDEVITMSVETAKQLAKQLEGMAW